MGSRVAPIVLLAWIAIGAVVWLTRGDDDDARDVESGVVGDDSAPAPDLATVPAPELVPAPRLERTRPRETAAALMQRLGQARAPAQRAEISAWLRGHPDRVGDLMVVIDTTIGGYTNRDWEQFFRDVFGPLHDLEPELAAGLIASLGAKLRTQWSNPPALGALTALAPLGHGTRQSLEVWVRENPTSKWGHAVAALFIDNAASGEVLPFVQWLLAPVEPGTPVRHKIYVPSLMHRIAALGAKGRVLAPELARYLLPEHRFASAQGVKALIAVGGDDPAAQRTLVALLTANGGGRMAAISYFDGREDAKQLLQSALDDESPRVRVGAVTRLHALGWASREVLLPSLLPCLTSKDAVWRDKAMRMIPFMAPRAEDVVPTLYGMFRSADETQWVTAARTLQLLASVSDDRFDVSLAMEGALRHPNVRVRRLVAQGLMNYPAAAAVPMLREALGDDDAGVREKASDALGELAQRDAGALAALRQAADSMDPVVVEMAEAWLEEIEAAAKQAALEEKDGG